MGKEGLDNSPSAPSPPEQGNIGEGMTINSQKGHFKLLVITDAQTDSFYPDHMK